MAILIASVVAFVSTNIDDLFMLALFYGNKKFREREIVAGQMLGIAALVAISLVGSFIGLFIDRVFIGLLGVLPMYLGVKSLRQSGKDHENDRADEERATRSNNVLTVAGITFANGGDNIGVYVPLFATLTWMDKLTMATVFLLMTLLWCMIAKYFTKHPYVTRVTGKYGHRIMPLVLIILGLYILYESGTVEWISKDIGQ
jgi:cadmium resistance transport/sequestration family protein